MSNSSSVDVSCSSMRYQQICLKQFLSVFVSHTYLLNLLFDVKCGRSSSDITSKVQLPYCDFMK